MYNERIEKLKSLAFAKDFNGLLITKDENKFYLSGFKSSNFHIVITKDKAYLLTDFRYIEKAKGLDNFFEVVMLTREYTLFDFLKELDLGKLGIEEHHINLHFYNELLEQNVSSELHGIDELLSALRLYKSKEEIKAIKKAASLSDSGWSYILEKIKPGVKESEIALDLEFFLRENGAEGLSFDTIVASGERSSLPHGEPTDRVIQKGDLVTIDFGCKVNSYCSDMTRTVGIGMLSEEQIKIYHIVLEAQLCALENIKAGILCREADSYARDIITEYGFGDAFGHGLGHGVGLEIHEDPTLSPASDMKLEKNMTITIEPGIYLNNKFGVRIEDLAVATDFGIINLTKSGKELIII